MSDAPLRVAVFGIGEAGSVLAAALAGAGAEVGAFDPADVATPTGVERFDEPGDLVKGRQLIMAVTAAVDAQAAIAQAWNLLPRGAIYADLSTAPPTLKQDLADTAALRGLDFADVALMAPVPAHGLATPSFVSGPGAGEYARNINGFGGGAEVVGDEAGQAATRKLLRSVVTKGLSAVIMEAMAGAREADLEDWLWGHVVEFIESADGAMVERLVYGTDQHLERRIVEMDSAASLLEHLEVDPLMTRATEDLLKRLRPD